MSIINDVGTGSRKYLGKKTVTVTAIRSIYKRFEQVLLFTKTPMQLRLHKKKPFLLLQAQITLPPLLVIRSEIILLPLTIALILPPDRRLEKRDSIGLLY